MIQQGFLMNGDCLSFIDHHEGNCTVVIGVEKVEEQEIDEINMH
jgi:hypothetical protein